MKNLEDLIHKRLSRRDLLRKAGKASAFLAAGSILPAEFFGLASRGNQAKDAGDVFFKPVPPSEEDRFVIPEGFDHTIIRSWGDRISDDSYFGFNNDYVAYLPIDLREGGRNSSDGLMFVNHEYPSPLFINNYTDDDFRQGRIKTAEEVSREMKSVGFSVFRVRIENGIWKFVNDAGFNRMIDATADIDLSGKAAGSFEIGGVTKVRGTLANCSGGVTPWGTVLSGEENFQDYYVSENMWEYRWNDAVKEFNVKHYGWVVEVDPFDKNFVPVKRTSLGRFRHENVAIKVLPSGRIAAYMGDDKVNECVYKYVSNGRFEEGNKESNLKLLDDGDLYVADFENGKWQIIDIGKRPELQSKFTSQADVLIRCDEAAKIVGGTECNRPEDIEFSPVDGSIFIAFTNNSRKNDYFGSIVRITEKENDDSAEEFEWEVFATGGVDAGFSCPDNLTFDRHGNLWVLCDISTSRLNKEEQRPFKNNSLFMIPTTGEFRGKAFRFATGPVECEMCGGNFTPDGSTLFISIQHPGENSLTREKPTSRWPNYGQDIPRPSVVAVTGFGRF